MRSRALRILLIPLLSLVMAQGMTMAAGSGEDHTGRRPAVIWGPHAESRVYGLSYIQEDDGDGTCLRGFSLLRSNWDETVDRYNGGIGFFLAAQEGDSQRVIGAGIEMSLTFLVPEAPIRFGPRVTLGAEHRRRDPDEGFGGLFGVGLETSLWLGRSFQIALFADREFSFPTDDRTQIGFALRLAGPRTWP